MGPRSAPVWRGKAFPGAHREAGGLFGCRLDCSKVDEHKLFGDERTMGRRSWHRCDVFSGYVDEVVKVQWVGHVGFGKREEDIEVRGNAEDEE